MPDRFPARIIAVFLLMLMVISAQAATYYIDYGAGSDANSGASSASPWKRHPYMSGFSGSYQHAAGDRFIFRGGVTWPAAALPMVISAAGVDGSTDYYGVDRSWYAGSAWARPIFDGEYSDSDCIVLGSSVGYLTIDSMELKRVSSSGTFGYGLISAYAPHHLTIANCHLHGWRTTNRADDAHGGIIFAGYHAQADTVVVDGCEIENAENENVQWNGVCIRMVGVIRNSHIHHNSSAVLFCLDFDRNELNNICYPTSGFDGVYHFNGVYLDPQTMGRTTGSIRNSVFHDVSGGANMAYLNGHDATISCYNNLFYGAISGQMAIEIDPYDYEWNRTSGVYHIYNNTGRVLDGTPLVHVANRGGAPQPSSVVIRNNHVIGTSVSVDDDGPAASYTRSNNLVQTSATAVAQGYSSANSWRPTVGGATVDAGSSAPTSFFSRDISGTARPQGAAWDIGAYEYAGTSPAPDTTTPSVHLGLTARVVSSSQVALSWNAASDNIGVTGYRVFRNGTLISTVSGTSFSNTGLSPATTYSFAVRALDAAGNVSAASASVSATTLNGVGPGGSTETIWGNRTAPSITADGTAYELGTVFSPTINGRVQGIRVHAAQGESGTHTARIWNNATSAVIGGPYTLTFSTAGWYTYTLPNAVPVTAGNASYTVSVTTGTDAARAYVAAQDALISIGSNGAHLTYPANAGVFATVLGTRPTVTYRASNYLRDIVFAPTASAGLPSGWTARDVGRVGLAGTATYANGAFTVRGSGADIWNSADAFQFTATTLNGDGSIVARVVSVQNTNAWAKAGVMIRESTATGARHAFCCVTPGNGVAFQRRIFADQGSNHTAGSTSSAPRWVKVVRQGRMLSGYESADGQSWTLVGTVGITFGAVVQIGLGVTSHSNSARCTAVFDRVTITPGGSG